MAGSRGPSAPRGSSRRCERCPVARGSSYGLAELSRSTIGHQSVNSRARGQSRLQRSNEIVSIVGGNDQPKSVRRLDAQSAQGKCGRRGNGVCPTNATNGVQRNSPTERAGLDAELIRGHCVARGRIDPSDENHRQRRNYKRHIEESPRADRAPQHIAEREQGRANDNQCDQRVDARVKGRRRRTLRLGFIHGGLLRSGRMLVREHGANGVLRAMLECNAMYRSLLGSHTQLRSTFAQGSQSHVQKRVFFASDAMALSLGGTIAAPSRATSRS